MKLIAKDLSAVGYRIVDKIDVGTDGDVTTEGVIEGIALDVTSQGSRPGDLGLGFWNDSGTLKYYDGSNDYDPITSGTTLGGDLSGNLPNASVVDDSHNHTNATLSGVPGAGIDTTAVHSGDAISGDLSGTYPGAFTVTAIQGYDVQAHAPQDGEVLTWVNSNNQWEPQPAGSSYYTVVDSTANYDDINTALSNYDVVYMEPGTYSALSTGSTATRITIPAGKQLIGLYGSATGTQPKLNIQTDSTAGVDIATGGKFAHAEIAVQSSSQGPVIRSNSSSAAAIIRYVNVTAAFSSSVWSGTPQPAAIGHFQEISHFSVYGNIRGISLSSTGSTDAGLCEITDFQYQGDRVDDTSGYGILLTSSSQYPVRIMNTRIYGVNDGIYFDGNYNDVWVSDLFIGSFNRYGIYQSAGIRCSWDNVTIEGISSSTTCLGAFFYGTLALLSLSRFRVYDCGRCGMTVENVQNCTVDDIYVRNCGKKFDDTDTPPNIGNREGMGVRFYNIGGTSTDQCTISNVVADSCAVVGVVLNDVTYATITNVSGHGSDENTAGDPSGVPNPADWNGTGVVVYATLYTNVVNLNGSGNEQHGVWVDGTTATVIDDVNVSSNAGDGFKTDTSQNQLHIGTGVAVSNTGTGLNLGNAPATGCYYGLWNTYNNTGADRSIGSNWVTAISDIADAGDTSISSPSSGDILVWDGSDSWDNQTMSGDATITSAGVVTVQGLQGDNINAAISPSNEHVLFYDGTVGQWDSKYPGMVNEGAGLTYVVLPSGSSASDINTALGSYDVVYLEAGTYSLGSTGITIPSGKKLAGVSDFYSNAAVLQWSGSPATRHLYMTNAILENVQIHLTGVAHTTTVVQGDSASDNNRVNHVYILADTSASIYGFAGEFSEVTFWSTSGVDGMNLTGRPSTVTAPGLTRIDQFNIYNAPTYGIRIDEVGGFHISRGYIDGNSGTTNYGIFRSGTTSQSQYTLEDIIVVDPGVCGIYFSSGATNYNYNIYLSDIIVDGLSGTTQRGIYLNYVDDVNINNVSVQDANGTSGAGYGGIICDVARNVKITDFYVYNCGNSNNAGIYVGSSCQRIQVSNGNTWSCAWGFYTGTATYCTASNIVSYDDYSGFFFSWTRSEVINCYSYSATGNGIECTGNECTYSNLYAFDAGSRGVYMNGVSYSTINGLGGYNAGTYGIYINGGDYCAISSLMAYSCNSSAGVWLNGVSDSGVSSVSAQDNTGFGIRVSACSRSTFSSLTAGGNTSIGIYLSGYSTFSSLYAYNNGGDGIDATSIVRSTITGFVCHANGAKGLDLNASAVNYVTVSGGVSYNNTGNGIDFGTNPSTSGSCSIIGTTSQGNGGSNYVTSGGWNQSANY